MVKPLTEVQKQSIREAVEATEASTSAEIAVVVALRSDEYRASAMAAGLGLGTLTALLAWLMAWGLAFSTLLCIQFGLAALVMFLKPLRHATMLFVPGHLRRLRADQRAAQEYMLLTQELAAGAPVILIYISLAERYAHIHTSRLVRKKIPHAQWEQTVQALAAHAKSYGAATAVIETVNALKAPLATHFPQDNGKHSVPDFIEVR